LASIEERRCINEGKTRNPLKFAAVAQTPEPISAVSGPKFAVLWEHVEEILLLKKFFPIPWCPGGELFGVLLRPVF